VLIAGGGHVGTALSTIISTLDFNVVLYDERTELEMFKQHQFADKKVSAPFSELSTFITSPQKLFVAIVTSNYKTDTIVLQQVLPLNPLYIGIMGVEAKLARIKNSLNEKELQMFEERKIHAPIGINIGSGSAEEIAISIAAEIIQIKNSIQ
jgi:xanthine dehydrogenase accessory factor